MEENDNMVVPANWVPTNEIIKVVGVGGAGVNAVTYMYDHKIEGCTFVVCNTDRQSLESSSVPIKIPIGEGGLGAGTDPLIGRNYALEATDRIAKAVFDDKTEMLFITAGMGGGTGTGAAPVIASMAKERGVLTVAVVTLPFKNDKMDAMRRAIAGVHELEQYVDSLLIINNEKLYEVYQDMLIQDAFPKTDDVLATAVRAVVDIIQTRGFINVDFRDVSNMMKDSGMALMGCGSGSGKNRLKDAITQALESPLLNDCDLKTAKDMLINITVGHNDQGLSMKDLNDIDTLIEGYMGKANRFKRGIVYNYDEDFKDKVNITVIATGFKTAMLDSMADVGQGNLIVIDENFEYDGKSVPGTEIELYSEAPRNIMIGVTTAYNTRKFDFTQENKPVLVVEHGQDFSRLESEPAISRRTTLS